MRTYKEQTTLILEKVNQYNNAKQKRMKYIYSLSIIAACLLIAFSVYMIPAILKNSVEPPVNPTKHDYAVYIPAIKLPENTNDTESYDMIGFVVYKGRIYTQTKYYYNDEATAISNLVGEWLGYAKGNIHEWSKQDDYAVEFAGSVSGDVYSVNGFSTDYCLCMKGSYLSDDDGFVQWINFYENLNDIGLTFGSDLFGERLNLAEKWQYAKYQEHDNWNNDTQFNYVCHDLIGVSDDEIAAFIKELYSGEFEYMYDKNDSDKFYRLNPKQSHLYFHMDDNTIIELILVENGYVGYRHLGWYFVKMPGDIFDMIFNACQ